MSQKANGYVCPTDVEFVAIRAQGAGGQNVNKVSSAIHLRFDIVASSLSEYVKQKILQIRDSRISREGIIVIKAQRYRTQEQNRQDALHRLEELIKSALKVPKIRRATKPTKASKQRRLDSKRKKSNVKSLRGKVAI